MAIKVNGTTVITDARQLANVATLDSTTSSTISSAVNVAGSITGTNDIKAVVKGDGSGGLRYSGFKLFGNHTEYVSGSGTYTVPANTPYIKVFVTGGGAGGGGSTAYNQAWWGSGGGGASSTIIGFFAVNTGDTLTYSVGAAGNGGSSQSHGGNGGNSTLTKGNTTLTANGGGKSTGNYNTQNAAGGPAGTTSISGSLLEAQSIEPGDDGGNPVSTFQGGSGGASFYGVGSSGSGNSAVVAVPTTFYGAGGGGSGTSSGSYNGGAGASGVIQIERWSGIE